MLILSRRVRESIMISDDVEITVLKIDGSHVQLGIKAPATVPIHRREIYNVVKGANVTSARLKPRDVGQLFLTKTVK